MDEEYYTIDQVAKRFQVTRAAVYKWMRAGKLPYVVIGNDRRITSSALKAFIKPGRAVDEHADEQPDEPSALLSTLLATFEGVQP